MKIRYEFATGEVSEIEVSEELGQAIEEMTYEAKLRDRAETRRHVSLEKLLALGVPFANGTGVEALVQQAFDHAALLRALDQLLPQQKELVLKVFFEGHSYVSIAQAEGVDESAIRRRMERAIKRLKKILK